MKEADVKARAYAMPLTNPAYPPGPYRFKDREFLIITYRTDPERLRAVVPEPLEVDGAGPCPQDRPRRHAARVAEGLRRHATCKGIAALVLAYKLRRNSIVAALTSGARSCWVQ